MEEVKRRCRTVLQVQVEDLTVTSESTFRVPQM